jgi:hypothetical protein
MASRKAKKLNTNPFGITTNDTFKFNGRTLTKGTEVSIRGQRGRFRFVGHVTHPNGNQWLDFIGGKKGCEAWRSFGPESIRTVHRINRTRANAA